MTANVPYVAPSSDASRSSDLQPHHWMAIYSWLACVLCYVDRTNMSVAMIPAAEEHGWDKATQGLVFSGFFMGYATTQLLGGVLCSRIGAPTVLLIAVVLWSSFTMITPLCASDLYLLMLARIGLGAGEGVAMPALQAIAAEWYPKASVTRYIALMNSGHQLGIVASLLLSPAIARDWGLVFKLLGAVGILWGLLFTVWPPEGAFARRAAGGAAAHGQIPWRELLSRRPLWAIYVSHFGGNFGFFILITWMPKYFTEGLGVPVEQVGSFTIPAYVSGAIWTNIVGTVADKAIAGGWSKLLVRRACQSMAMLGGSASLLVCALLPRDYATPPVMALVMCVALMSHGSHCSGNMANIIDIAQAHAGMTHAVSNTIATLAGVVGNLYVGWILPTYGWGAVFYATVCVYLACLMVFLLWSTAEPQFALAHARKPETDADSTRE